jgi:hypothetical protein
MMRDITIPFTETHAITIDLKSVSLGEIKGGMVSLGAVDTGAASKLLSVARNNAGKVVYGVVSIERMMQQGITTYLFGIGYPCTPQRNFFVSNFLESSFIEFSAKKTIYVRILEELKLVPDKKSKEDSESKLRRIMNYRNAMAHGAMKVANGTVHLEYYQGESKRDTLNNEYWDKLESAFRDAFDLVRSFNDMISTRAGVIKKT